MVERKAGAFNPAIQIWVDRIVDQALSMIEEDGSGENLAQVFLQGNRKGVAIFTIL